MSKLFKVGDRVITPRGAGTIVGVEVHDPDRPGHLKIEEDPELADKFLANCVEDPEFPNATWARIMVKCHFLTIEEQKMFPRMVLAFFRSDNLKHNEWVKLSNGDEYQLARVLEEVNETRTDHEKIEYYTPNDEHLWVRVKCGDLEQDTTFYDMDDFLYKDSDYRQIVRGGKFICNYEEE